MRCCEVGAWGRVALYAVAFDELPFSGGEAVEIEDKPINFTFSRSYFPIDLLAVIVPNDAFARHAAMEFEHAASKQDDTRVNLAELYGFGITRSYRKRVYELAVCGPKATMERNSDSLKVEIKESAVEQSEDEQRIGGAKDSIHVYVV